MVHADMSAACAMRDLRRRGALVRRFSFPCNGAAVTRRGRERPPDRRRAPGPGKTRCLSRYRRDSVGRPAGPAFGDFRGSRGVGLESSRRALPLAGGLLCVDPSGGVGAHAALPNNGLHAPGQLEAPRLLLSRRKWCLGVAAASTRGSSPLSRAGWAALATASPDAAVESFSAALAAAVGLGRYHLREISSARNSGPCEVPAAARSAATRRSTDTIRTSSSTRSKPMARTTHRTASAPRRHQRRRRR